MKRVPTVTLNYYRGQEAGIRIESTGFTHHTDTLQRVGVGRDATTESRLHVRQLISHLLADAP